MKFQPYINKRTTLKYKKPNKYKKSKDNSKSRS